MSARRLLITLHSWIGAATAVFVLLVAGSGGLLAFMPQVFALQYGDMLRAAPPSPGATFLDVDRLIVGALGATKMSLEGVLMPDSRVAGVETALVFGLPEGATGFDDLLMVSVDPFTGVPKGRFHLSDAVGHELIHFHQELFAGEIGSAFVSLLGLLLAAFAATGVWLWWPRAGSAWAKARRLDLQGTAPRKMFRLHGWLGVWAALLIVFFSLTGTATSRPGWFGPLLEPAPGTPPVSAGFDRRCEGTVSPGMAARLAEAAHPGKRLTAIYPSDDGIEPHTLHLRGGEDFDRRLGDTLHFAHATCVDLGWSVNRAGRSPPATLAAMMLSLHGGYSFGSVFGPLLVVLAGLAGVILAGTGLVVFATRTLKGKGRRPPTGAAVGHPARRSVGR